MRTHRPRNFEKIVIEYKKWIIGITDHRPRFVKINTYLDKHHYVNDIEESEYECEYVSEFRHRDFVSILKNIKDDIDGKYESDMKLLNQLNELFEMK